MFIHLDEPLKAAKEILRVLKPGGLFGAVDGNHASTEVSLETVEMRLGRELYYRSREHRGVGMWPSELLGSVLREAGFDHVDSVMTHVPRDGEMEWVARDQATRMRYPELVADVASLGWATREQMEKGASDWEEWASLPGASMNTGVSQGLAWKAKR